MYIKCEPKERFLDLHEIMELVKISRPSLHRWEKMGLFPSRRKIGPSKVAWLESEVIEWMRNQPKVHKV